MKRTLLAALAAALLLSAAVTPASAERRTVPVTVDGAALSCAAYLDGGVTTVPLRTLLDALGGWTVRWDGASGRAEASSAGRTVAARPGDASLTVDGLTYPLAARVYIENGRTYVPLRTLCEALGASVSWDAAVGGAAVKSGAASPYSADDLYWLSRIISAESRGESLEGQIAVGNVVLNRVRSAEFPDTIRGVVFDTRDGVQFEPVALGTVYAPPTELSVTAARAALGGESAVGACLYFYAPALSQGTWINANRAYYKTIGCHRFYL